jgi:hypothetical protein
MKPCPNCGKPMEEQPKFKGLWTCPDKIPINDAPPFQLKCDGMELTEEGAAEFEKVLTAKYIEQYIKTN